MRGSEALVLPGEQKALQKEQKTFRGVQRGLWSSLGSGGAESVDRDRSSAPGAEPDAGVGAWRLDDLFGRLVELSGSAAGAVLTFAFRLVREAQQRGEPVVWITGRDRTFFPPDVAEGGVDLAALAVVRLPSPSLAPRAADPLVRSGGFGLLVMDLGVDAELTSATLPIAVQSRLAGLAKRHHAALLCLTRKPREAPSLGSLVSLRGEVVREAAEEEREEERREEPVVGEPVVGERAVGRYRLAVRTLKRKGGRPAFAKATAGVPAFAEATAGVPAVAGAKANGASATSCEELCRAPDGLC